MVDYDIVLGKPWLTKVNPMVDWRKNALRFRQNRRFIKLKVRPQRVDNEGKIKVLSAL